MSSELTTLQISMLRVLAKRPPVDWLTTGEIGRELPEPVWKEACSFRGHASLTVFIANQAGPILGVLARAGYLVRRANQRRPRSGRVGEASEWKLGPLADQLKEQGLLD